MRTDLLRFDLQHGLRIALRVLREELGSKRGLALRRFLVRSLTDDPFQSLPSAQDKADEFTRHQLKPLLIFYRVLREDLAFDETVTLAILRRLASENGAVFVAVTAPHPSPEVWSKLDHAQRKTLIDDLTKRFENMESTIVSLEDTAISFDVNRCRFVELLTQLGQRNLAPLICDADRVFYDDPLVPIRLDRDETLASGGSRCTFRLTFQEKT